MQAHTKKFTIFKICTPNYGEFPSIIKKGNWSGIQTFIGQKDCSHKGRLFHRHNACRPALRCGIVGSRHFENL